MSPHDSPELRPAEDYALPLTDESSDSESLHDLEEHSSEPGSLHDDGELPEGVIEVGGGFAVEGRMTRHVESPLSYFYGGHFPVHLGDCLGPESQYRVIHKLGTGGFANVWLCRVLNKEPTQYVALKIVQAHLSGEHSRELDNVRRLTELAKTDPAIAQYCLLSLDAFKVEAESGVHQCFVYPVAGPCVQDISRRLEDPHSFLRDLTRQAGEAMAALHRHDFRPSNILFRLDGLNGLSEDELFEIMPKPETATIFCQNDADEDICPPAYLVFPVELDEKSIEQFVSDKICVIDFGESFDMASPPSGVGIPLQYAPPELALDSICGAASDIFALAATMYEIRFGEKLFLMWDDTVGNYLHEMINQIGRLPEPLWSKWVEKWRSVQKQNNENHHGDDSKINEESVRRATIQKQLKQTVSHLITTPEITHRGWHEALVEEERQLLEDLLYAMTENDPAKRLSIEQVLQHPWFSFGVEKLTDLVNDGPQSPDSAKPKSPVSEESKVVQFEEVRAIEIEEPCTESITELKATDVEMSPVDEDTKSQTDDENTEFDTVEKPESNLSFPHEVQFPQEVLLQWRQELDTVRVGVLAVFAWLCRTFGL